MREIKFRAWDKSAKVIIYDGFDIDPTGNIWINHFGVNDQFMLMQYTNLKDRNGKEIYEGDIVRSLMQSNRGNWEDFDRIGQIVFGADEFPSFMVLSGDKLFEMVTTDYYEVMDIEIIGNIYENPELLEANK